MLRRNLVLVAPIVAVAIFVGIVVWYSSTQPSRVERIVACVEKLGYSTSTFHDDGVEPLTNQDPDIIAMLGGTYPARPPSDHVLVNHRYGTADVTVPDNDVPLEIIDHGDPLTARERAAVAGCAQG